MKVFEYLRGSMASRYNVLSCCLLKSSKNIETNGGNSSGRGTTKLSPSRTTLTAVELGPEEELIRV
jgi:hypothetical protein